jgi:23S rRNA pseudouridine1911/1915/1917 synthase
VTAALNRGWTYRAPVDASGAGVTVLDYLADRYRHTDRAGWARRLHDGEVAIGGATAHVETRLHAGEVVVWHRPPWVEPDVPLTFDLLHADDEVVAVAKPSGLPTMPAGGFVEHTLLHLVRGRFGAVHPLHRLGRGTSGIVLFARTTEAAARLAAAWRDHAVQKDYRTLVDGEPPWDTLDVRQPIGRAPHPRLGAVYAAIDDGRAAHSHLTVVERRDGATLLDVRITTGRPHQIRIHCAWAGHPLSGDPLYTAGGAPRASEPGLPGDGGYLLHAWRLGWRLGGDERTVEAPLPAALRTREQDR